jgi:hypothetical protein
VKRLSDHGLGRSDLDDASRKQNGDAIGHGANFRDAGLGE